MRPLTVQIVITASREEIFDLIADYSRRVAWTDHFVRDLRLARAKPVGLGAAARFVVRPPLSPRQWAEVEIAELDRPRRIVEEGRFGRLGRSGLHAVYDLGYEGPRCSRLTLTAWTEPGTRLDAVREALGARPWLARQLRKALRRLRTIFEEPSGEPLERVTVAGFEPLKKARFGA